MNPRFQAFLSQRAGWRQDVCAPQMSAGVEMLKNVHRSQHSSFKKLSFDFKEEFLTSTVAKMKNKDHSW